MREGEEEEGCLEHIVLVYANSRNGEVNASIPLQAIVGAAADAASAGTANLFSHVLDFRELGHASNVVATATITIALRGWKNCEE